MFFSAIYPSSRALLLYILHLFYKLGIFYGSSNMLDAPRSQAFVDYLIIFSLNTQKFCVEAGYAILVQGRWRAAASGTCTAEIFCSLLSKYKFKVLQPSAQTPGLPPRGLVKHLSTHMYTQLSKTFIMFPHFFLVYKCGPYCTWKGGLEWVQRLVGEYFISYVIFSVKHEFELGVYWDAF